MPMALRIALVVLGLAVAAYGAASLTGGWLGEPLWWRVETARIQALSIRPDGSKWCAERVEYGPRPGREWISAGVVVAGLSLVTAGAWRRRPKREATT